jgi:hypothetical protein
MTSLGVAGCDSDHVSLSMGGVTGPATVTGSLVTVVPAAVRPEFLASPFCTPRPFQAQFGLLLRAHSDLVFSGFRFEFLDRFGGRSVPTSIATTSAGIGFIPSVPTSSPIPLPGTSPIPLPGTSPIPLPGTSPIPIPGTSPIPIPGITPFDGLLLSAGSSHTLPFVLQFGCGVSAPGTLFVNVHTLDWRGTADVTRVSIGVLGS